jgi:nucleotide sugar dehydrogenase
LVYCPERYNPGDGEHTISKITRVIGGISGQWTAIAAELYGTITNIHVVRNIQTAEMAKIIENTQRDLNIALMNEIALICEKMGLDAIEVIKAAATKWNFSVYYPGAGVGGHCLPKDPWYLVKAAERYGYHAAIITAGRRINDHMPYHIVQILVNALNNVRKPLKGSRIVVLGLSYKEEIGDTRNSPSKPLIHEIKKMGAEIHSVDPFVSHQDAISEFEVDSHFTTLTGIFDGADAIVLMTPHSDFKNIDFRAVKQIMSSNPIIVDGRRIYSPDELNEIGFIYRGIGKG